MMQQKPLEIRFPVQSQPRGISFPSVPQALGSLMGVQPLISTTLFFSYIKIILLNVGYPSVFIFLVFLVSLHLKTKQTKKQTDGHLDLTSIHLNQTFSKVLFRLPVPILLYLLSSICPWALTDQQWLMLTCEQLAIEAHTILIAFSQPPLQAHLPQQCL